MFPFRGLISKRVVSPGQKGRNLLQSRLRGGSPAAPASPTSLAIVYSGFGTFDGHSNTALTSNAVPSGVTRYDYEYSNNGLSWFALASVNFGDSPVVNQTDIDVIATQWYYRVRAYDEVTGLYSPYYYLNGVADPGDLANTLYYLMQAWYRASGDDYSGNARTLTSIGSPSTTTGIGGVGNAMLLGSTALTDYYSRPTPIITALPYSFAAWIRPDAIDWQNLANDEDITPVLQSLDSLASAFELQFYVQEAGVQFLLANFGDASSSNLNLSGSAFIHVGVSVDGSNNIKLYLNGSQIATGTNTQTGTADEFRVGGADLLVPFRQQFTGVWSRVLSAAEFVSLYASGAGFDPTAL